MIERDFYHWLKLQAKKQGVAVLFNSVESHTIPGFPDIHALYHSQSEIFELKSSRNETLYYQKNQIAYFYQAHTYRYDIPTLSIINNKKIYLTTFIWGKQLTPSGEKKIAVRIADMNILGEWDKKSFKIEEMMGYILSK